MFTFKHTFLVILLLCLISCKKEEEIKDAAPFATAGTNQSDVTEFQVALNADSLAAGQKGKWTIDKGLVEDKVFFSDDTRPDSKFNGMPGEVYQLRWKVTAGSTVYSESTVKITFKALKAVITNTTPTNSTQFFLTGNSYDRGLWTVDGKYAKLISRVNGGTVIPDINSPYVEFQGYAFNNYKITWTTYYGSKSASTTITFKTGDYLESEALNDLQLTNTSSVVGYESGHITSLDLSASAISWILRDTLQYPCVQSLKYLKKLNLSGSATFSFPAVISDQYKQLEYLNLSFTSITSFPGNIGNLTKLKQLIVGYLQDNATIISLPDSFGDLVSLEYLQTIAIGLQNIPESFSNLKNLKYCEMTLNPLQKLPANVGNLANLQVLLVTTQQGIPASISKLSNLRRLSFFTSAANPVLPSDFGNLTALDTLDLEGQYQTLPASFGNLKSMMKLQVVGSVLTAIPDNFGNMSNLEDLTIGGVYKNFPSSFTNLTKLKYFSAESSLLQGLPTNIGNLKNLVYMSVEAGPFKTLPESIGGLVNLTELRLDGNQLETLPAGFFNLPKIKILWLQNNKIASLSSDFGKLSGTLQTLYLYGNPYPSADGVHIKQLLPTTAITGN